MDSGGAKTISKPPTQNVDAGQEDVWYQRLASDPESHIGKIIYFRGKVVQSLQSGLDYVLRINVSVGPYETWKDTVYVEYRAGSSSEPRIVENNKLRFRGKFVGIKSYTAVLGNTIQIPHLIACDVRNESYLCPPGRICPVTIYDNPSFIPESCRADSSTAKR
jgi:hypothetical protein